MARRRIQPLSGNGVSALHHGDLCLVNPFSLSLSKRYVSLCSDFKLRIYNSERHMSSNTGSPKRVISLTGVSVEWGRLETQEFALRLRLDSQERHRTCCCTSQKCITFVASDESILRLWIRNISVLFANTGHSPVARSGDAGTCGDECTICLSEFTHGELLTVLPCKHRFH